MNVWLTQNLQFLRRSKRLIFLVLLPPATAAFLLTIPLFRDFDYEFNAVLGVVVFLSSVFIAIHAEQMNTIPAGEKNIDLPAHLFNIFQTGFSLTSISLLSALAVVFVSFIFMRTCCIARGLQFFVLLPLVSGIAGSGLGFLINSFVPKYAGRTSVVVLIVSLIFNLYWIKHSAPIFVYSIFWGYFPGPIYDEWIPIDSTLWMHRLWTVCFAMLFITISLLWRTRPVVSKKYLVVFLAALITVIAGYDFRKEIGFDAGYDKLKMELTGFRRAGYVDLIFDKDLNENEINWIGYLSEFYYERVHRFLELQYDRRITIYCYKDEYQKKKLMGAGATNFAKIFNDEIHINFDDAQGVLEHEITHVLANDFGHAVYGTMRLGFLEGLAVASEWNESYFTPHEWAAALKKQNKLPDVVSMVKGGGFFQHASGMSYIVSGSFTRFLIDNYGMNALKRAYHSEGIKAVYGLTADSLAKRWKIFLDSVPVSDEDVKLSGILIQPALFQKRCPHLVADILEKAGSVYAAGEYKKALSIYQDALEVDPENYRIEMQLLRSQFYAGEFLASLSGTDSLMASKQVNYLSRAVLHLLKGDLWLGSGQTDSAVVQYRQAANTFSEISHIVIAARLRLELIKAGRSVELNEIVRTPDPKAQISFLHKILQTDSNNATARYWLARLHFLQSDFDRVIEALNNANISFADSLMEKERLGILAESYLRLSKFDVSESYWLASKKISVRSMEIEYIEQRLLLLQWLRSRIN